LRKIRKKGGRGEVYIGREEVYLWGGENCYKRPVKPEVKI